MRSLIYLLIGILFGVTMYKSEAASWYRIYEMFNFHSIHMYGIIGVALILGIITHQWIKRSNSKSFFGNTIEINPKEIGWKKNVFGGIIFGLGWALAGACPGPMYTLLGAGYAPILIVVASAILGTFVYGVIRSKLPH